MSPTDGFTVDSVIVNILTIDVRLPIVACYIGDWDISNIWEQYADADVVLHEEPDADAVHELVMHVDIELCLPFLLGLYVALLDLRDYMFRLHPNHVGGEEFLNRARIE